MSELNRDIEAVEENKLYYRGEIGYKSEKRLELVFVSKPNTILGNAVSHVMDPYEEYSGNMPILSYKVITFNALELPSL